MRSPRAHVRRLAENHAIRPDEMTPQVLRGRDTHCASQAARASFALVGFNLLPHEHMNAAEQRCTFHVNRYHVPVIPVIP